MGFSRQYYWSGLPFLSPGGLPDPGVEYLLPTLQADCLPSEPKMPKAPDEFISLPPCLLAFFHFISFALGLGPNSCTILGGVIQPSALLGNHGWASRSQTHQMSGSSEMSRSFSDSPRGQGEAKSVGRSGRFAGTAGSQTTPLLYKRPGSSIQNHKKHL